ncbi:single-stranded DNA-binding protein [Lujinxingia litoralis]|uniref:Single-stranded DNA-binding protein n=1 Tax=Lujinxingia litoralis TaxID=2211119 RepID=A0A328C6N4_9DELT|nr:single-stranded DNA-binding protein [Lujinxingia litoralis]RAL22462.1 single-stranded DNA-binding protein [Lujinxingia litoralis]
MSLNKAMIIGNLGSDPEVRYTQSGAAVTNFNVATNESWVDKSGQRQERTEWHRVVVFGKQAENCGKYLSKGRQVFVEGRLQTRDWEDRDGNKRSTTEIVAMTVQFLSSGASGGRSDGPPAYTDADRGPVAAESSFDQSFNDDDIPF